MTTAISYKVLLFLRACSLSAYVFSVLLVAIIGKRFILHMMCGTCHSSPRDTYFRLTCNHTPPELNTTGLQLRKLLVKLEHRVPTLNEIEADNPDVTAGGAWEPTDCRPQSSVAILVPYRDREVQLRQFLAYIHPFLQAKRHTYRIYLINQTNSSKFNRGRLLNIGFSHASKDFLYDCYICHDIDRLPVSVATPYACGKRPVQIGVLEQQYRDPFSRVGWKEFIFPLGYVGGVTAMTREHFVKINGFSNQFFGWGGEDDDLRHRLKHHGLNYTRVPVPLGRFRHLTHEQGKKNPIRESLLISGRKKFSRDGLSNLQYTVERYSLEKLYTLITADFQPQGTMRH